MLTDTHCHLDFPQYEQDLEVVIQNAKRAGLTFIINIGSSLKSSRQSVRLSKEYDFIYSAVGLHPHEWENYTSEDISEIKSLSKEDKVVAIGECGLDYYGRHDKERQKRLFLAHIGIARERKLPLIVHTRDAHSDTFDILRSNFPKGGIRGVVHCFSGDEKFLRDCLDAGLDVSFTCNITYKKAENLRRLVNITPVERLLLETDAPFLPPQEFRGRRNEPAFVKYLAEAISAIKGISFEELSVQTEKNARRLFNI